MRPAKLPRPTEHWPTCIGISDSPCERIVDPTSDYEIGPMLGKLQYRCKGCWEKQISRETRNTVYATAEKEMPE